VERPLGLAQSLMSSIWSLPRMAFEICMVIWSQVSGAISRFTRGINSYIQSIVFRRIN